MVNFQQEKPMTVQLKIFHLHDGVKAEASSRYCNLNFYISLSYTSLGRGVWFGGVLRCWVKLESSSIQSGKNRRDYYILYVDAMLSGRPSIWNVFGEGGVTDGSVAKSIFQESLHLLLWDHIKVKNMVACQQSRHSRELLRSSQTSETEPTSARRKVEPTQAR